MTELLMATERMDRQVALCSALNREVGKFFAVFGKTEETLMDVFIAVASVHLVILPRMPEEDDDVSEEPATN